MVTVTPGLTAATFAARRQAFAAHLPVNAIALILGYPHRYFAQDHPHVFRQQSDLLYLTGFLHPDAVAVFEKRAANDVSFRLFVEPEAPSAFTEPYPTYREIERDFGADQACSLRTLDAHLHQQSASNPVVFLPKSEKTSTPLESTVMSSTALQKLSKSLKTSSSIVDRMRLFKSPVEIQIMRKAASAAARGFRTTMRIFGPTNRKNNEPVAERLIQAALEMEFIKEGTQGHAYPPVVAGAGRGCALHYIANADVVRSGEMVLVDAGAYYGGYTSDITRTWPISGTFSQPQRELYNAVLQIQMGLLQGLQQRAFRTMSDVNKRYQELTIEQLQRLSIINPKHVSTSLLDVISPHLIGHYLGMDTHDTPSVSKQEPLQPGQIVTVEPGLYIPNISEAPQRYRGLAVRIEDDVLITEHGAEILTSEAPKLVDELEHCIKSTS